MIPGGSHSILAGLATGQMHDLEEERVVIGAMVGMASPGDDSVREGHDPSDCGGCRN